MPHLTKEALSKYIRTECKRQLRLYLSPDNQAYAPERTAQQMPPVQPPRPGLPEIRREGEEWQAEKLHDLTQTFGATAIVGNPETTPTGSIRYRAIDLASVLTTSQPGQFLVEAQYRVGGTFEAALGIQGYRAQFGLTYADARPDLIEVFASGHFHSAVLPNGDVHLLAPGDERQQLRIIDIKMTAEPSPSYFAEVTYYAMALAGWLIDQGLDSQYVIVPNSAIWAGSHDAANLTRQFNELRAQGVTPTPDVLRVAMQEDLEEVPFEVFAARIRRFLQQDLPEVLAADWHALPWHVDNRCKGCEYLGYPWLDTQSTSTAHHDHCIPEAERLGHLSRIADLSRGAKTVLTAQAVPDVATLAQCDPADAVFDGHHVLRATRTVVSCRATSLQTMQSSIAPGSGTSAIMPRWADLRIYLSVDFDLGSAITVAFGIHAFPAPPNTSPRDWQPRAFIVDAKSLHTEQRELFAFLNHIDALLTAARAANPQSTVQFYLWDSLQFDHLKRVIGRHLQAILSNNMLRRLAWLFPPEELLPNPALSTRRSPITIVRDVVRAHLAAPIPHYYSLLQVARAYHRADLPAAIAAFRVHPLFEDELSDQVPSERAHEIWGRSTHLRRHWQDQMRVFTETVVRRLTALQEVTRRLEADLRPSLSQTAPPINIAPPPAQSRVSADGNLWYTFAKLNEVLSELETHQIRAMPPHEREARFQSARLVRQLTGQDETDALARAGLPRQPGRRVYELRPTSREVKFKDGDFGCALAPENAAGFLDQHYQRVVEGTPLEPSNDAERYRPMERVTNVTIRSIDRDRCEIILDADTSNPTILDELERHNCADFRQNVILDPVHRDFFTNKLLAALQAIGNPPTAAANPLVLRSTGQTGRGARRSAHTPPADLLWSALSMHSAPVTRVLSPVQLALQAAGVSLNPRQWQAWTEALSRRLQLIWGPPGTGKSRTVAAIVAGAALEAYQQRRPMRILVCADTYTAIDTVLLPAYQHLQTVLPAGTFALHRLRSKWRPADATVPTAIDLELNRATPSSQVRALRHRLRNEPGITVVGATPEQVYNLLTVDGSPAQQGLFDLILIDEASQMDVASAILPLCALTSDGSVVLAGDPKQLPPIHQAEPPTGLEAMVGSIYTFCAEVHDVPSTMLDVNYRSNRTLVEFALSAGYEPSLRSHSPDLRLNLVTPLPMVQPGNWPSELPWSSEWAAMLDPTQPAVCFVYAEGRSSQWNRFEADAVASLIYLLHGRLADQLDDELHAVSGAPIPCSHTPYDEQRFWGQAVGVVTPHRAQQGLIISCLQRAFTGHGTPPAYIRDAVDTVERFQGQQRDVIIASFSLGDPDAIHDEDEFLLSLNRFNVMASRARAKLVVLITQEVVDHLSHDLNTLRQSRLVKLFTESYCGQSRPIQLPWRESTGVVHVPGLLRYH